MKEGFADYATAVDEHTLAAAVFIRARRWDRKALHEGRTASGRLVAQRKIFGTDKDAGLVQVGLDLLARRVGV